MSGGLIGVVLYCILILLAANKMVSSRVSSTIVLAAFGCLLVVGLMESLITITWPLVLPWAITEWSQGSIERSVTIVDGRAIDGIAQLFGAMRA